ncbi:MAG: trigger factor [Caldilineaceae bacterium SB0661_bin_32]|uniref:Trigger factor n=1 Tax=Caldilineaceae bacterium SB0661_bin_32 TaxID=2605255 RepID=A0A6B1D5D7_9CHLR|nr:trigger factor [Caldilineaceae bacterium SB0661_bin_32]
MTLTVTTEPLESRQLAMTIEVAEERIDQEMRKAARKVAQQVRIPGFRKGRVPFQILLQFVGREAIIGEFVDELGQDVYKEALEQEGLEPFYMGSLDNVDTEQAVRFHLTIPLPPEVTLGEYRDLRVEEEEVEADEEQIQERVQAILEQNADYVEADRPSQYGDLMTIDLRGVALDDEGNESETIVFDEEDWDVTPDQENPMEPAGLDEELVGLSPGEEKSFEIAWPEDSPSMYAGATVRFSIKVHKTQAFQTPPEMTDEIAQNFGPDFETAADLLEDLRENALQEAQQRAEAEHVQKVLQELIDMSDLAYPPVAVELEIDRLVRNVDMRVRQMGMQGLQQFLEFSDQTIEDYRESSREEAEKSLRIDLALIEFSQRENLKVSNEEFEEHIGNVAGSLSEDADEEAAKEHADTLEMMRADHSRPLIESEILKDKSIKLLLAIARGEDVPEPDTDEGESEEDEQSTEEDADQGEISAGSEHVEEETASEAAEEPADS